MIPIHNHAIISFLYVISLYQQLRITSIAENVGVNMLHIYFLEKCILLMSIWDIDVNYVIGEFLPLISMKDRKEQENLVILNYSNFKPVGFEF